MRIIGQSLIMKNLNRLGVSLTEISVAVLIFAVAAIPLYYGITYGTKEEIQLNKDSIAQKILESFRDEIKNLDYKTVKSYGSPIDATNLPPNSFNKFFDAQKQYKDFTFEATAKETPGGDGGVSTLTFVAKVTWTKEGGNKSERKISFIKVEQ